MCVSITIIFESGFRHFTTVSAVELTQDSLAVFEEVVIFNLRFGMHVSGLKHTKTVKSWCNSCRASDNV